MAKYTAQVWIAGYSQPSNTDDLVYCNSKQELKYLLLQEHEQAQRWGAGYEPSEMLVWKGELTDVTDQYPDFRCVIGPRNGVKWESC